MHTRYKDMSWLISCAAHTMKRVTFSLKKLNLDDATYTYVSFCFSLLLNATTLDSASQLYRHICIILLTPTVTSEVEAAKHKIREALAQRVVSKEEEDEERKEDDRGVELPPADDIEHEDDNHGDDDDDDNGQGETIKSSTIKNASPFALHFKVNI